MMSSSSVLLNLSAHPGGGQLAGRFAGRRRRQPLEQLRIAFFLEQHRDEPVLQVQRAGEGVQPERVLVQPPLAVQHRVAHPPALGQRLVKRLEEPPGSARNQS